MSRKSISGVGTGLRLASSLIAGLVVTTAAVIVPSAPASAAVSARVVSWGSNRYQESKLPTNLSTSMVRVAAGDRHSLALQSDGTVVAWGDNRANQSSVPSSTRGAIAIAAGALHSLALLSDGTVKAWGYNSDGQSDVPSGMSNVVAIAAGGAHSLALTSSGFVRAWGSNRRNQTSVPTSLSGVVSIAAGRYHSLAVKRDGTVVAWGANGEGQSTPPSGLTDVVKAVGGVDHSLALKSDGTVVGWGSDLVGQATPPTSLKDVVDIAAGDRFSLALTRAGLIVGWGYNSFGQVRPIPDSAKSAMVISAAGGHALALVADSILPPAPMVADNCGRKSDEYYIPSLDGVNYLVGGSVVGSGWHSTGGATDIAVGAVAQGALRLDGTTSWNLSYTDDVGCAPLTKSATPKIRGTAKVGKKLKVVVGRWTPSGVSFKRQWFRVSAGSQVAIPGATGGTYKVSAADAGARIAVSVTGSKSGYAKVTKASKSTKVVPLAKIKTKKLKLSGRPVVGSVLSVNASGWKPSGLTLNFQWYHKTGAIPGANQSTYPVAVTDLGTVVSVKVTASAPGFKTVTKSSKSVRIRS